MGARVEGAAVGWTPTTLAAVPAALFDPPGRRGAVLVLHPDAPGWPALTAALAAHLLAGVAPSRPGSWWLGEAERHTVEELVPWVRQAWGVGKLAAVGVGPGGNAAVRLGFRRPDLFPVVGGIAGAFDLHQWHGRGTELDDLFDTPEQARQASAVLHLDPQRVPRVWLAADPADPDWRGADRLHEKLTAYGVPHHADLDATADDPQAFADAMIGPLLAWAADALQAEGRRLV